MILTPKIISKGMYDVMNLVIALAYGQHGKPMSPSTSPIVWALVGVPHLCSPIHVPNPKCLSWYGLFGDIHKFYDPTWALIACLWPPKPMSQSTSPTTWVVIVVPRLVGKTMYSISSPKLVRDPWQIQNFWAPRLHINLVIVQVAYDQHDGLMS